MGEDFVCNGRKRMVVMERKKESFEATVPVPLEKVLAHSTE